MSISGTQPNWGALVDQGRAKSYGVPWSEKELHAIYELKIPVDYVRQGILTLEELAVERDEVTNASNAGEKPVHYMTKEELNKKLVELGVEVSGELGRHDLIRLVKDELEKRDKNNLNEESTLLQSDEGDEESGTLE